MDLHAWITQQVDRVEFAGRRLTLLPADGSRAVSGTVTDVSHGPDGINLSVAQYGAEPAIDAAVLRRCEADRRILARHRAWPQSDYCDGCDADLTTYLADCPELLDLAHAHGLTPEILAGLDRPQPPEPTPAQKRRLRERARLIVPITTSDVPEALRGPRWKP